MYQRYYCNLITLVPFAIQPPQANVISSQSPSGWYVLYPPTPRNTNQPVVLYFPEASNIQGRQDALARYAGYTSQTSQDDLGSVNYPVGISELIYQRVEDAPLRLEVFGDQAANKDVLDIVGTILPRPGRHFGGKRRSSPTDLPSSTRELYCLYCAGGSGKAIPHQNLANLTYLDVQDWLVGSIRYKLPLANVIVPTSQFGQALTANLRYIGSLSSLARSIAPRVLVEQVSTRLPEITGTLAPPTSPVVQVNQRVLTIQSSPGNRITLSAPGSIWGNLVSINTIVLGVSVGAVMVRSLTPNSVIDLSGVPNVTDVTVTIGNQTYQVTLG